MEQHFTWPVTLTVISHQSDYTLEDLLKNKDLIIPFSKCNAQDPDFYDDKQLFFTFNSPQDLTAFLLEAIKYTAHIVTKSSGDDSYFDYIPLYLEEYQELLSYLKIYLENRPKHDYDIEYYTEVLQNTIILSIQFFNAIIEHQDDGNHTGDPNYWFDACFEPIKLYR